MSPFTRWSRRVALTVLSFSIALAAMTGSVSAASVPAHGGQFSCAYDAAGNRVVSVYLPTAKGTTNRQQVWWYAAVYKKVGTTFQLVGYSKAEQLTGFANQNGMISGSIVPGFYWTGAVTNTGAVNGGSVRASSAGVYQVAGYFWWAGLSTSWTADWATYYGTGTLGCTFS